MHLGQTRGQGSVWTRGLNFDFADVVVVAFPVFLTSLPWLGQTAKTGERPWHQWQQLVSSDRFVFGGAIAEWNRLAKSFAFSLIFCARALRSSAVLFDVSLPRMFLLARASGSGGGCCFCDCDCDSIFSAIPSVPCSFFIRARIPDATWCAASRGG